MFFQEKQRQAGMDGGRLYSFNGTPGETDMGKEIESDEFKKLITLGEEKGFLTYDDVNDLLARQPAQAGQRGG